MALSTVVTPSLEEVAKAASGPLWFQLYVYEGAREFAERLVKRAERAGYRAIVLTVDAQRFGNKERELRPGAELPSGLRFAHFEGEDVMGGLEPAALSWEDVAWLRSVTSSGRAKGRPPRKTRPSPSRAGSPGSSSRPTADASSTAYPRAARRSPPSSKPSANAPRSTSTAASGAGRTS